MDVPASIEPDLQPLAPGILKGRPAAVTGSARGIRLGIAQALAAEGALGVLPGMGAMDMVAGAKRVIVAMPRTHKGRPKFVRECALPLTSDRPLDLIVTALALIRFTDGRATLLETHNGVTVEEALAATEAGPALAPKLAHARGVKSVPEKAPTALGETV